MPEPTPCPAATDAAGRELARHGSAPFPVASYDDDLAALPVPWHWHEELELILATEGLLLVDAGQEKHTLCPGQGLFINAGVLHAVEPAAPGPCRLHSLVFHPRLVGGAPGSVFWQEYLQPLLTDATRGSIPLAPQLAWQAQVMQATGQAYRQMAEQAPGYAFGVRAALSQAVFLLCHHTCPTQPPPQRALRNAGRVKTMLQFIQAHYAEPLTIREIAASAAISVSECLRCFHEVIGATPIQYLRQYRVQRAAELLCGTGLRVTDISLQCGFSEVSYFARAFRQVYGLGPSEYRRRAGQPAQATPAI